MGRPTRESALLLRAAACAALSLGCLASRASAQQAAGYPTAPVPFPHRYHVPVYWFGESQKHEFEKLEVARDCRGCHDWGERDASGRITRPASDPRDTCTICHYAGSLELEESPEPFPSAGDATPFHLDHLDLACRQCHLPAKGDVGLDRGDLPGRQGEAFCATCHGGERGPVLETLAGRELDPDPSKLRRRLLDALNSSPALAADGRGPFRHGEHMLQAELSDPRACAECHGEVATAAWNELGVKEFSASACARCHLREDESPVEVEPTTGAQQPSSTALTFEHVDHLRGSPTEDASRNVADGAQSAITSQGCLACHEHAASPSATYTLRAERVGQAGCASCHDVPRFRTKEHGNWQDCAACHDFGPGDPGALRRAAVERVEPGQVTFRMPPQRHPGLASSPNKACSDCHKASVPELPTRIAGVRFEHASHLGEASGSMACETCHAGAVNGAVNSSELGLPWEGERAMSAPPRRLLLTFDFQACGGCHPGIEIDPTSLASFARRDGVPDFPHALHLERAMDPQTGERVGCTTCHPANHDARGPVGTAPGAQACTQCHLHDAVNSEWTGRVSGDQVGSCKVCHEDRMPRPGDTPAIERGRVSLTGAQHHPDDRACAQCHELPESPLSPITVVRGSKTRSKQHVSPVLSEPHPSQVNCYECHWAVIKNEVSASDWATGPVRERCGNVLEGYPGTRSCPSR